MIEAINSPLYINAFLNAFWVFVGIVAGAVIQFGFHYLIARSQKNAARKLFLAEITINREELAQVEKDIERKKNRFVSGQVSDLDFIFDFKDFNYRMVDPLINSGHFHSILDTKAIKSYFRFMNDLNIRSAENYHTLLKREYEAGRSVKFFDSFLDQKIVEWKETLNHVEALIKR